MSKTTSVPVLCTRLLSLTIMALGTAMFAGGIWLATLGGSIYYLLAGLGLLVSAVLIWRSKRSGAWCYGAVILATIVWSAWESGSSYWGWLPRLGLLLVLGLALALVLPRLEPAMSRSRARLLAIGITVIIVGGAALAFVPHNVTTPIASAPILPLVSDLAPDPTVTSGDWRAYGHDTHATRSSPLKQITPENVDQLRQAWVYRTGDLPPVGPHSKWAAETTPLKVGDAVYLCSATNDLIRLDPASGKEVWRHKSDVGYADLPYGATCRGVAYFESSNTPKGELCHTRVLQATLNAKLVAVDAETGKACPGFGEGGRVDLMVGMGKTVPGFVAVTSPPPIVNGVVVVNHQVLDGQRRWAPSGVIRGYSAETGEFLWAWDVKRAGDHGLPPPGQTYSRGTPNSWAPMVGDDALGLVYVPIGNPAADYYSAMRSAEEREVASSVVALDIHTGNRRWVFQTVHNDVWDYDIASQPTLFDFRGADGSAIPAMLVFTKRGENFVLDRRNGQPLTKVEERPAPPAVLKDDPLAPTQPWSVDMPRFRLPDLTEQKMWGLTPLDQLYCRIKFRQARYEGEFTPPSVDHPWIAYPVFSSNWGSAAFDPGTGILVANWNATPMYNQLLTRAQANAAGMKSIDDPTYKSSHGGAEGSGANADTPYGAAINVFWLPFTQLLCNEPPYGMITAVDMHERRILWQRPLGTARANGPFGIASHLPIEFGTPNIGGPIITAGGLAFVAAATDNLIRAIDLNTGKVVWSDVLPAGGQATPMTYEYQGRQYLLIVAGGHHFLGTPTGDYVIAYALPQ